MKEVMLFLIFVGLITVVKKLTEIITLLEAM